MVKVDRLLLCDCAGSMKIDRNSAEAATGAATTRTCSNLCTTDIDLAAGELAEDGTTLIACGQQAALFRDLMAEIEGPGRIVTADIRDRAGWTADTAAHAKQAALLAEAVLDAPMTPLRDILSDGLCLIVGRADVVIPAANELADSLSVTCLLTDRPDDLVPTDAYDVVTGQIRQAAGAFAGFALTIDGFAPLVPSGRGGAGFAPLKDGAKTSCDIIVDLTGGDALFPAPDKRDGYLRADPRQPAQIEAALRTASQLVGEFDKPIYIRFDAQICAHSRASQQGCDRCLSVCPTGAILPDGDSVTIDPDICAGCGACAAVCPSGAASYDNPSAQFLFSRLRTLAQTYKTAGGTAPRVLFHDGFGAQMISLSARFGRGLPADVIPVSVDNVEMVGHAELVAALGVGFSAATVLAGPKSDTTVIAGQMEIARALLDGTGQTPDRVALIEPRDPDLLEHALYDTAPAPLTIDTILPLGSRRDVTRLATAAFAGGAQPVIPLPQGAPYGAVEINKESCTLCLSCVSLCPVGALADNPDKPEVRFQQNACLQCGICESTCPEDAITLRPELNLENAALSHVTLHGEEPFECIECGKPFGVKSTIDRIVDKLKDKHAMFTNSDNYRLIQMCDTCRISAQYHQEDSPFKSADRPRVRTTQDYLDERDKDA